MPDFARHQPEPTTPASAPPGNLRMPSLPMAAGSLAASFVSLLTVEVDRAAWEHALRVFEEADTQLAAANAAYSSAERAMFDDASDLHKARAHAAEKRSDDACEAAVRTLAALLHTAAPDIAAVQRKLELAIHHGSTLTELTPLCADLARLGGDC